MEASVVTGPPHPAVHSVQPAFRSLGAPSPPSPALEPTHLVQTAAVLQGRWPWAAGTRPSLLRLRLLLFGRLALRAHTLVRVVAAASEWQAVEW